MEIIKERSSYIPLLTLVSKEIVRILRIWPQTILPAIITMSLYFLIFGNLIGERIGSMQNVRYIEFIVPGLIMMSVIINSYSNVVSSLFSAKFQNNIEEMIVAPISRTIILLGFISGGIFRGCLLGCIITLVALLFTQLHIYSLTVILITVVLTSSLFSLAGFINALYATKFDDINIFTTFILSPLTYLGGVFYSVQLLPEFWQKVSLCNPILYMVNVFRYGFLGF